MIVLDETVLSIYRLITVGKVKKIIELGYKGEDHRSERDKLLGNWTVLIKF